MPISSYYVLRRDDPEAKKLLHRFRNDGYQLAEMTIERVFYLEGDVSPSHLLPLLVNPIYEQGSEHSQLKPDLGPIIEVCYQPAVTDPETPSILEGAKALGVTDLKWARIGVRYQFVGIDAKTAEAIVHAELHNEVVQRIIPPDHQWTSLQPHGTPDAPESIPLAELNDDQLIELNINQRWLAPLSQLKKLQEREQKIGRLNTRTEVEITLQSWCDHCNHLTWERLGLFKRLMDATLKINHPLVVNCFGDNAGGIDFYDGWTIFIKGESHNYPSATATYGGIMTEHGGIHRDLIFVALGGYPIGGCQVMGTSDPRIKAGQVPKGALHPRVIVRETIRGTADYCNPMGIPMMQSIFKTHPGYVKCWALGHAIGIVPKEFAQKGVPLPGDTVILIGGKTGRDGIHGATVSSGGMSSETIVKDKASVQIGHPITERQLMTVIPVLRDRHCVRAETDLGAGGISCAGGEMGAETGIEINLDLVPLKDESLADDEITISESQERGLLAVPPDKVDETLEILKLYGVEATVIGTFTDTHRLVVTYRNTNVADLDMGFLWDECPIDPIEIREPVRNLKPISRPVPDSSTEWEEAARRIISHYHCCDQSAAGNQFDSTVQGRTVIQQYGGKRWNMPTNVFVSAPLRGKPYGAVFTLGYNSLYGEIDPAGLGRLMAVEAISKAVALGVHPSDIVLCDNVYTPKINPENAWNLKTLVDSFVDFSLITDIPYVSGKDSSSGTFVTELGEDINVPVTFVCATLCRVPDVRQLITKPFKKPGNQLVVVGLTDPERLGGSVYLDCYGERGDKLPDYGNGWGQELLGIWKRLSKVRYQPDFYAASAIAEGGLFMRLFEMALGGEVGVNVDAAALTTGRLDGNLFGEHIGTMLFELHRDVDPERLFGSYPWKRIGVVTEEPTLTFTNGRHPLFATSVDDLRKPWEQTFKEVVA